MPWGVLNTPGYIKQTAMNGVHLHVPRGGGGVCNVAVHEGENKGTPSISLSRYHFGVSTMRDIDNDEPFGDGEEGHLSDAEDDFEEGGKDEVDEGEVFIADAMALATQEERDADVIEVDVYLTFLTPMKMTGLQTFVQMRKKENGWFVVGPPFFLG